MMSRKDEGEVPTINEENGTEDTFDEEYIFSAGSGYASQQTSNVSFPDGDEDDHTAPTRTPTTSTGFRRDGSGGLDDDDGNTVVADGMDDSAYEAAPPSFSTPPVQRSVDILPTMFSSNQPSNVLTDEVSVYSEVTEHSMSTLQMHNRHAVASDDATVVTTSTMATRQVFNRIAPRDRGQLLMSNTIPFAGGPPNGMAGNGLSGDIDSSLTSALSPPSSNMMMMNNANTINNSMTNNNNNMTNNSTIPRTPSRHPSTMGRAMINNQGHTMSAEEMRLVWESAGLCGTCGVVTTHRKEKYGPFGTFRRMAPQTAEGYCYKGYCLQCHDVSKLRRLLNEPDLRLDAFLVRGDDARTASIRNLQLAAGDGTRHHHQVDDCDDAVDTLLNRSTNKSPLGVLCTSIKFQLCCGIVLLAIAGAVVAIGISLAKRPEPWVSQAPTPSPSQSPSTSYPTSSPTSWDWTLSSEIMRTDVESFGYGVELSSDGNVLAVASPFDGGGRGRFDVYILEQVVDEMKWVSPDFSTGTVRVGQNTSDNMSRGLALSGDGSVVAAGSPGSAKGLVQVYTVDFQSLRISAKGQAIEGPTVGCEFGYSVSLNFDGSRLFVGAPNYGLSATEITGLVRVYGYNSGTNLWEQVGSDVSSDVSGSRFGHSLSANDSGYRFVVGAPLESSIWEKAGQLYFYALTDIDEWENYQANRVTGSDVNSRLGTTVATNADGLIVVTNDQDAKLEQHTNSGIAAVYGIDPVASEVNTIGFPIFGTHTNAGFGHDIDVANSGEVVIASGRNIGRKAGSARVFLLDMSEYQPFGQELMELEVGTCTWYGAGPSVTVAARQLRMAIGYECIMVNGVSRSVVRVFDYFAVE